MIGAYTFHFGCLNGLVPKGVGVIEQVPKRVGAKTGCYLLKWRRLLPDRSENVVAGVRTTLNQTNHLSHA